MRLPSRLKVRGNTPKYLLKKYAAPLLPPAIVNRSKKGFPVPVKDWFRRDLAGYARETLLDPRGGARALLPGREIERVLRAHEQRDCSQQIYALLVLDQWHRLMVTGSARVGEQAPA